MLNMLLVHSNSLQHVVFFIRQEIGSIHHHLLTEFWNVRFELKNECEFAVVWGGI